MRRMAFLLALVLASLARADYLGCWKIDDLVTVTATTHRFSTGAAYAATGDVHLDIYEDDTPTQIIDDTDMAAFDSVTGLYLVKVQLLEATGFEPGKHYTCVISATVDGVSGILTHNFQIEPDYEISQPPVYSRFGTVTAAVLALGLAIGAAAARRKWKGASHGV